MLPMMHKKWSSANIHSDGSQDKPGTKHDVIYDFKRCYSVLFQVSPLDYDRPDNPATFIQKDVGRVYTMHLRGNANHWENNLDKFHNDVMSPEAPGLNIMKWREVIIMSFRI